MTLEPVVDKLTTVREDKQMRHISFVEEPLKKSCPEVGADSKNNSKSSKWNLAVLPRVGHLSIPSKKTNTTTKTKLLDTIQASCSLSDSFHEPESAIQVIPEEPAPPPPPPPAVKSKPKKEDSAPVKIQPSSPSIRRKYMAQRSMTLRNPMMKQREYSIDASDGSQFCSLLKSHGGQARKSERNSYATIKIPQRDQRSGAGRFSRHNSIQVVSDVQGVLTDILRDIIPKPNRTTPLSDNPFDSTAVQYGYLRDEETPTPKRTSSVKTKSAKGKIFIISIY